MTVLQEMMRTAFAEHETKIAELKRREADLEASLAEHTRQKIKLKERESKTQKQHVVSEGTS